MKNELKKRIISSLFIIPVVVFLISIGSIYFTIFLSILFILTIHEWLGMTNKFNFLRSIGIIYLFLSFFSVYLFRNDFGLNIFLFVITICILTDIGGFTFGKIFKGPKLIKISPKKTYSGVIGSFIFSIIGSFIFVRYIENINSILRQDLYLDLKIDIIGNNFLILTLVIFVSLVSQIGDLVISYFKRNAKIKDTGTILPGHGGLLDRIDGMIFVFPFTYLILSINLNHLKI